MQNGRFWPVGDGASGIDMIGAGQQDSSDSSDEESTGADDSQPASIQYEDAPSPLRPLIDGQHGFAQDFMLMLFEHLGLDGCAGLVLTAKVPFIFFKMYVRWRWQYLERDGSFVVHNVHLPHPIQCPVGICHFPDGTLCVSDSPRNRLQLISQQGECIRIIPLPPRPRPHLHGSVDVHASTEDIRGARGGLFVADCDNHRILASSSLAMHPRLTSWMQWRTIGGDPGPALDQLAYPRGVAAYRGRFLFVADSGNHRIVVYNQRTRKPLMAFGGGGGHFARAANAAPRLGETLSPFAIALHENHVYVCCHDSHAVMVFEMSGPTWHAARNAWTAEDVEHDDAWSDAPAGAPDAATAAAAAATATSPADITTWAAGGLRATAVRIIGQPGRGVGEFHYPRGVAIVAELQLLVVTEALRVQVLTLDGNARQVIRMAHAGGLRRVCVEGRKLFITDSNPLGNVPGRVHVLHVRVPSADTASADSSHLTSHLWSGSSTDWSGSCILGEPTEPPAPAESKPTGASAARRLPALRIWLATRLSALVARYGIGRGDDRAPQPEYHLRW